MKSKASVQPQELKAPKTVSVAVYILSIALSIFATAVIVTISNWFLFANIQTDARASVVEDMKLVSKTIQQ